MGIMENEMVTTVITSNIFLLLLGVLSCRELSFISSEEPVWEYLGSILGSGFCGFRGFRVQGCQSCCAFLALLVRPRLCF